MNRRDVASSIYDRRHAPAAQAAGDGVEGAYSAVLHAAPSAGTVLVVVPALWGLAAARTAVCSSTFTGSPGDRVMVIFDETKQPWVIATLA